MTRLPAQRETHNASGEYASGRRQRNRPQRVTSDPKRRLVDKVLRDPTAMRHCSTSVAQMLLDRFEGWIQPL